MNFTKKELKKAIACIWGLSALVLVGCNDSETQQTSIITADKDPEKRVLVIGIDGLMYDYIDDIDNVDMNEPVLQHFPRLSISKALAGGYLGTQSHQASSSGPSWSTILTGTWVDGHSISSNNNQPAKTKTVFEYLHNADSTIDMASFAAWSPINTGHAANGMPLLKQRADGSARPSNMSVDEFIATKLVNELKDEDSNLDFIFTHLDEIDGAGHTCGWCTSYEEVLSKIDNLLGQVLDAVEYRESNLNEQWLVLVVSDHGHVKTGGHGGDSIEERTSVIGTNKPDLMNELFANNSSVFSLASEEQNVLMGYPGITAIVPTVLHYLGYELNAEHQFSSPSLIGNVGLKNSYIQTEQPLSTSVTNKISWRATSDVNTVSIFRGDEKIAEVSASDESFEDIITLDILPEGDHHLAYTLKPNTGNSITAWTKFAIGEAASVDTVLEDVAEHVSFQESISPFSFISNNADSVIYEKGPFDSGKALRINRDDGYLTTPISFQDVTQRTLGFWLKVNGEITSDPNVISNKNWDSGSNPGFTIAITNSSLKLNIGDGVNRSDISLPYTKDTWIFVVASFDLINNEIALYIQDPNLGFQESKSSSSNVASLASEFPLNIAEGGDGDYNLNSIIDISMADLLIFNRVLANNEARALSNIETRVSF
ncbi:alkaline phosphatase family protein [Thalassotalea sp. PP2-459]|uniref:alkaline phosphatase family protein n=2 Tax=Thalassotalea TaxID=1518149 RepID=UPI0009435BCC|nr:alkaline phosphatase family protein [Thalassotalea sp. PP2-459]OKY26616.1 hypothetical protein BI291_01045 [Thalassotalea sp. PP2-459]